MFCNTVMRGRMFMMWDMIEIMRKQRRIIEEPKKQTAPTDNEKSEQESSTNEQENLESKSAEVTDEPQKQESSSKKSKKNTTKKPKNIDKTKNLFQLFSSKCVKFMLENVEVISEELFNKLVAENKITSVEDKPYKIVMSESQFYKYVQMNCNLYINYLVIDAILTHTDTKRFILMDHEWLNIIFEKAAKLELLSYFASMSDETYMAVIDELKQITHNTIDEKVFNGERQISLGITHDLADSNNIIFYSHKELSDYIKRLIRAKVATYNKSNNNNLLWIFLAYIGRLEGIRSYADTLSFVLGSDNFNYIVNDTNESTFVQNKSFFYNDSIDDQKKSENIINKGIGNYRINDNIAGAAKFTDNLEKYVNEIYESLRNISQNPLGINPIALFIWLLENNYIKEPYTPDLVWEYINYVKYGSYEKSVYSDAAIQREEEKKKQYLKEGVTYKPQYKKPDDLTIKKFEKIEFTRSIYNIEYIIKVMIEAEFQNNSSVQKPIESRKGLNHNDTKKSDSSEVAYVRYLTTQKRDDTTEYCFTMKPFTLVKDESEIYNLIVSLLEFFYNGGVFEFDPDKYRYNVCVTVDQEISHWEEIKKVVKASEVSSVIESYLQQLHSMKSEFGSNPIQWSTDQISRLEQDRTQLETDLENTNKEIAEIEQKYTSNPRVYTQVKIVGEMDIDDFIERESSQPRVYSETSNGELVRENLFYQFDDIEATPNEKVNMIKRKFSKDDGEEYEQLDELTVYEAAYLFGNLKEGSASAEFISEHQYLHKYIPLLSQRRNTRYSISHINSVIDNLKTNIPDSAQKTKTTDSGINELEKKVEAYKDRLQNISVLFEKFQKYKALRRKRKKQSNEEEIKEALEDLNSYYKWLKNDFLRADSLIDAEDNQLCDLTEMKEECKESSKIDDISLYEFTREHYDMYVKQLENYQKQVGKNNASDKESKTYKLWLLACEPFYEFIPQKYVKN